MLKLLKHRDQLYLRLNTILTSSYVPYQEVDMDNIVQSLNETGSSYFIAQCAYGKTIMFFYLLMLLKQRTIIVLPTTTLMQQTYDALVDRLTILNESRFSRLIELFTRKLMFSFASLEGLALVRRMENPMKTLNPLKALKISNMLFSMKFICLQLLILSLVLCH